MIVKTILVSNRTHQAFEQQKEKAIVRFGIKYKVPVPLIKAIIKKESGGNFWATRYERHLRKAGWYKRTILGIDLIMDYHFCSFGLMQILYGMAKHYGMWGSPFKLYRPDLGIKYGCKHLRFIMRRYKNLKDVVSVYNAGSVRKTSDGHYSNQEYVDDVMKFYYEYGGR